MSRTLIKMLPLVALAAVLAGCGGGSKSTQNGRNTMSQGATAPAAGTVIATVNGEPITSRALDAYVALRTHGAKIQLNDAQRYQVAQQLVQLYTVAQAATRAGIADKPDIQAGLALQKKLYLANEMMENYLTTATVPESVIKSEYAAMVKAQSGEEYKARHILVKSESEAKKIINELNHGANFAKLAKKDSIGPSAKQGGDLGWFKADTMVKPFAAALVKLKPGHYTKEPVKTQFGWHVILLEKERTAAPPSYTASKPQLESEARNTMVRNYLDTLQKEADVHMMLPNPASAAAAKAKTAPAATTAPKPTTHKG